MRNNSQGTMIMPVHINKTLEYSSDPESELNSMRRAVWCARNALGRANRAHSNTLGCNPKSEAMRQLNIERAKLRRLARMMAGNPITDPVDADFETTVAGIPCGIVIDSYTPYMPRGCDDPGEPEGWEYTIVDRNGYRSDWIESKMDKNDEQWLDIEIKEFIEEERRNVEP